MLLDWISLIYKWFSILNSYWIHHILNHSWMMSNYQWFENIQDYSLSSWKFPPIKCITTFLRSKDVTICWVDFQRPDSLFDSPNQHQTWAIILYILRFFINFTPTFEQTFSKSSMSFSNWLKNLVNSIKFLHKKRRSTKLHKLKKGWVCEKMKGSATI